MIPVDAQLSSIHNLLQAGQRPLRIHRHTLCIWGGTAALLSAMTDPLLRAMNFELVWQLACAVLIVLGIGFVGAAWLDKKLTLHFVRKHDLTIPFVQEQITKVWWLLIALGILLTSGMTLAGGDRLVYGLWIAIFGMGLFIHGAFSEELPEWVGAGMLLLGIVPVALQVPVPQTRWLAVCAFGIGMPVLALMLDGGQQKHFVQRLLQSLLWLASVLAPALAIYQWTKIDERSALENIPLASAQIDKMHGPFVMTLPEGTLVPFSIALSGPMLATDTNATINLKLKHAVEVEMRGGAPTGFYRYANSPWLNFNESLRIPTIKFNSEFADGLQPAAKANIVFSTDRGR